MSEADYKLMQQGICPYCKCKMSKHSKYKLKVCKSKFAELNNLKKPQLVEVDDDGKEISRKDLPFEMVTLGAKPQ